MVSPLVMDSITADMKLYSMMQVFLLPPTVYMDSSVAAAIDSWLDSFVKVGSHTPLLSFKFPIDVGLVEKVVAAWSLHSFAHRTPGRFVALFCFAGALSSDSNPFERDQERRDEFEAATRHVASAMEMMWPSLPLPPISLKERFRAAFQATMPIQLRSFLAEYWIRALCSPKAEQVLSGKTGDEASRFYLATMMHWMADYLFGSHGVPVFAREQVLADLVASKISRVVLGRIACWNLTKDPESADLFAATVDIAARRALIDKFPSIKALLP